MRNPTIKALTFDIFGTVVDGMARSRAKAALGAKPGVLRWLPSGANKDYRIHE